MEAHSRCHQFVTRYPKASATSQAVTRVNAEQALYGAFFVKEFQRDASFFLHQFFCSI
jgi:hypothetical protein